MLIAQAVFLLQTNRHTDATEHPIPTPAAIQRLYVRVAYQLFNAASHEMRRDSVVLVLNRIDTDRDRDRMVLSLKVTSNLTQDR